MVASPFTLIGYTALAATYFSSVVVGSPLETNPTTPLGVVAPLTSHHPAYGAKLKGDVVKPVIKFDPNAALAQALEIADVPGSGSKDNATQRHLRGMENADSDLSKLEDAYGEPLERNFNVLKSKYSSGSSKTTPWPGSYWPTYRDGINAVWKSGEPSASEKFARAFGKDVKQFQDAISARSGILGHTDHKACTSNANCQNLGDGSRCAIRAGQSSGYCIPTWYGICHAWAPAAELEPEPKCPTSKNGVTFRPMDIKALMTQLYNDAAIDVVFLGARFDGPDSPLNLDRYNRFVDPARRDLGPGLFHIAMTNVLGKRSQSFVLDVAPGSEVWNQPVSKYQVVEARLVDPVQASRTYYGTRKYPFNADMKNLAYVRTRVSWIIESNEDGGLVSSGQVGAYTTTVEYEYFLELDDKLNIIGGEWLDNSNQEHPDFFWFPKGPPSSDTVTDLGMSYKDIRAILDASVACQSVVPGSTPAPTTARPVPTPAPTYVTPNGTPTPTPAQSSKAPTPAPNAQTPSPNAQTPPPTAQTPAPTAQTPTPTAQTPKPTTVTPAPTAQTPKPTTPATPTPFPSTPAPVTPGPTTPVPVIVPPQTPCPSSPFPTPTTPGPVTPAPTTPAPVTPGTPTPVTPSPVTPAPSTPRPVTPAPGTPAPVTPSPSTPHPVTPCPSSPGPVTPAPVTPAPVGQSPQPTPAATTPGKTPVTPAPSKPSTPHTAC